MCQALKLSVQFGISKLLAGVPELGSEQCDVQKDSLTRLLKATQASVTARPTGQ